MKGVSTFCRPFHRNPSFSQRIMSITAGHQSAAGSCQVIMAPARPEITGKKTIFLAGSTNKVSPEPQWRETLAAAVDHLQVTIFNPHRRDWDSTWKEDVSDPRFKGQVEWELEMQEKADLGAFYFQGGTEAPVSLLEFGLRARSGKPAIAGCQPGYKKRGNVQIVCQKHGIQFVNSGQELNEAVVKWMTSRIEAEKTASMPPSVD